uniref:Uncharacterized protein n=1 Tax=Arundo donax TaxID=35708 RepID=A0A0A8ZVG0_ARUDO
MHNNLQFFMVKKLSKSGKIACLYDKLYVSK